ncbi:MAG: DUF2062 domain-containing protein [Phycisphaerae bacterium]
MRDFHRRIRKFIIHKVLHADDSPHVIALGLGIGMFVAFLPLVGVQTFLALALAALLRANKAVCVPVVWITNPATLIPIYYGCLVLGQAVLHGSSASSGQDMTSLSAFAPDASVFELAYWKQLIETTMSFATELWVGCLIVSTVLGCTAYFLARWGVTAYRERRRRLRLERQMFRAQLRKQAV